MKIYSMTATFGKLEHETLTLGELRDLINSSRKYTLAVLEYYDKNRITKKDGDLRYLVGFRE